MYSNRHMAYFIPKKGAAPEYNNNKVIMIIIIIDSIDGAMYHTIN